MSTPDYAIASEQEHGSRQSARRTVGLVLVLLAGLLLAGSAATKFAGVPGVVRQMAAAGFAGHKLTLIAALESISATLFLLPRTRSLGVLLVSAYLGGAISAHVQGGDYPHAIAPAFLLALAWSGTAMRHHQMLWSLSHPPSGHRL